MVEWKYKGSEIFSFRSRWLTFDLWDFSGTPELDFMSASFHCETSLHLVVCDATTTGAHDLVRQLADLQVGNGCGWVGRARIIVWLWGLVSAFTSISRLLRGSAEKEKKKKKGVPALPEFA